MAFNETKNSNHKRLENAVTGQKSNEKSCLTRNSLFQSLQSEAEMSFDPQPRPPNIGLKTFGLRGLRGPESHV